ncbi:hypothetical protein [Virgibacillus halodenitrificans]|uniref:hypothetical protein n=1 Tax=Virgibacillus halodenitrificans TaxID=1482 RepID=UPI000EF50390|nr:hypothetical protein [Virgibacillus halodenitrificans]
MSNQIQITYQEPYFYVFLGENEVVGHCITSFFEAYELAKKYKQSNKGSEIITPKHMSELINVYDEMRVIAKKMDLPTNIFKGLADKILFYIEEHKNKSRSFDSFMDWLRIYSKNNYIH